VKIIAAVDGSKYGRWALEWIARVPFKNAPDVTALHVVDIVALKAPFMIQPAVAGTAHILGKEISRLVQFGKKVTADSAALLSKLRLRGKAQTVKGAAAPTILQSAPGPQGLMVVGSRGLTGIDRFLLGSVSTRVTTHATCSTMVVKQPPRPLRRLLFATDGSKPAEKALRFMMRELNPAKDGRPPEIVVLHVTPMLPFPELKAAGQAIVADAADQLRKAGYRTTEIVQMGDPADQIMKVAGRQNADLIVTGAKGLGAIARFLMGSVSTKLVQHSTRSVLIVR